MRRFAVLVVLLSLFGVSFLPIATLAAQSVQIVDARAGDPVTLQNVEMEGDVISGEVVNHAGHAVREVSLLIQHVFAWENNAGPGTDDPSRAKYYAVPGKIPAGGSTHFSIHFAKPLPTRKDGTFVTRAQVAWYMEVTAATPIGSHVWPLYLRNFSLAGANLRASEPRQTHSTPASWYAVCNIPC